MAKIKGINLLDYVEGMTKANIGPMKQINKRQTRQPDTIGKLLGGLSQAPKSKVVQSFPVTVEDMSHQEN